MILLNSIVDDFQKRLIASAVDMSTMDKKTTLKARHAQAATNTLLSGELARLAVSAGTRASTLFCGA